jgi:hypothetical protein
MGVNPIIFAWVLLLLAALIWIAFNVRRMKAPEDKSIEFLEKQNQLMEQYIQLAERTAVAVEKIAASQSGQPG